MDNFISPQIELIEEYFNDIIARIKYIKLFCDNLKIKNFTSDTPITFSDKIFSVCEFFENILPSIYASYKSRKSTSEQKRQYRILLFTINENLKELSSHIRFAQSAQARFLPYSIVKPLENEITKIEPDVLILFRPQWSYDYSCRDKFFEYYNNLLTKIYKSPSSEKYKTENKSSKENKKLFVIAFPSIERKNILLHCLLGHELGHVLFSTKDLINLDRCNEIAAKEIRKKIPEDNLENESNLKKTKRIKDSYDYIHDNLWMKGFEEIVSDIIGTLLFGPSFLFALFESIFQNNFPLDNLPDYKNKFYPPWRTRLRYIYNLCYELKFFPIPNNIFQNNQAVIKSINKRINSIKKNIDTQKDIKTLFSEEDIKIAYEQIFSSIENLKKHLIKIFKNITFDSNDFYNKVENLIYRIKNGITPNEIMNSQSVIENVNLFEIIAAGWFYKIGINNNIKNQNKVDETYSLMETNNRLILKAIEYSYITEKYHDFLKSEK